MIVGIFDLCQTLFSTDEESLENCRRDQIRRILTELKSKVSDERIARIDPESFSLFVRKYLIEANKAGTSAKCDLTQHLLDVIKAEFDDISDLRQDVDALVSDTRFLSLGKTTLWPDTISTLDALKERGICLAVLSNCHNPVEFRFFMDQLGISSYFDKIVLSGEIGDTKPSGELVQQIQNELQCEKAFVVGDQVHKDVKSANLANVPGIWANIIPHKLDQQIEIINANQVKIDAAIYSLCQLPSVLDTLDQPGGFRIGVLFCTYHKRSSMTRKGCFQSTGNLRFVAIEPYASLESQGPFDAILHKITEIVHSTDERDIQAIARLRKYAEDHPNVKMIDGFSFFEFNNSRELFLNQFELQIANLDTNGITVRIPWTQSQKGPLEDLIASQRFPILIKSAVAVNTPCSHFISLVKNITGLNQALVHYPLGSILQEYLNHDATVYKVYFIGDKFWIFPNASISNVEIMGDDFYSFNSLKPFPAELRSLDPPIVREVDYAMISKLGAVTRSITQASLFGFDFIIHSETGDYVVIDFNYFSSYASTPNLGREMNEHISNILNSNT